MIKRASTILLTLFLLLSSAQVWGTEVFLDPITTVTFVPNPGSSSTPLSDFVCPGMVSMSASANANIDSNGLELKKGTGNLFTFHLKDASTVNTKYSIVVTIASNNNAQFRFIATKENGHSDYSPTGQEWSEFTGTQSFSTYAQGGTASFSIEINNNAGSSASIVIKSIKITGYISQKIVSDNGDDLCAGEDNKFTALGVNGNITWTLDGQPIKGAKIVGNTITFAPTEGGTLKAVAGSTSLTYKFTTRFCCAVNADRTDVSIETFTFKNSGDRMEQIDNGIRSNISTGYNMAPSLGEIKEDKYAIIKSTDGTWGNWYNANGAKIVYGHTKENSDIDNATLSKFNQANGKNSSYDGFIAVNCNVNTYSKNKDKSYIFEYRTTGICKNTYHDFSAFISNVDAKVGEADINVKFLVTDGAGNKLLDRSTGYIKCGDQSWNEYGGSFETKDNEAIVLTLYNNNDNAVPNSDGNIVGNDVGVDDIRFSRCVPRINVHFNTELTSFKSDECNNTSTNKTINLYVGHHDYNVAEILDGAWFIVLQNKGDGWKRVSGMSSGPVQFDKTHAQNMVTATLEPNQGRTEYKAIVASSKSDVELIENGATSLPNNCSVYNITKPNEIAVLDPACTTPCIDSNKPKMNSYLECPTEANEIDLTTLIKEINTVDGKSVDLTKISDAGELSWYKQDPEDETKFDEIKNTKVPFPSQGEKDRYVVRFKQKDDATQTYCISDTTQFTVGIKSAIDLYITEESKKIELCYDTEKEVDYYRTFFTDIVGTVNNVTYQWTDTDGNPISGASGDSYTLPIETLGKGSVTVVAIDNDNNLCPSKPVTGTYEILKTPYFDVTIDIPCKDQLATNGIKINLTNIAYDVKSWFEITRTSDASNKEYASLNHIAPDLSQESFDYDNQEEYILTDKFESSENPTKVQYKIHFGNTFSDNSWCAFEQTLPSPDEFFDITDTNKFGLTPSATATNIKKEDEDPEYHICEGGSVSVKAGYELKAGEHLEWKVNGETPADADADSQSYTISEIKETTTFKATIIADEGVESCGGSAEITIYVDKKPEIAVRDTSLCAGESVVIKVTGEGDKYVWTPDTYLSNAKDKTPKITPEKTTKYSLDVTKGVCTVTVEDIDVVVNPLPEIGNISVDTNQEGQNTLKVEIDDVNAYSYSLDGITYGDKGVLPTTLPIGYNQLYVMDEHGCKSSKLFEVEPTPIYPEKYFTPNGDGVNETWNVENLNMYPAYIVEIFDRYSKRLFVQRVGSFNTGGNNTVDGDEFTGWDGMYNGHPMPSDDYWYLITVEEIRKQYTGHFMLKR